MIKRWRPFWSYDVEKTERWLSEMAADGKRLIGLKRLSRVFLFEEAERQEVDCQISYDKFHHELPRILEESGWEHTISEGNWQFIRNTKDPIHAYPVRDGLLKRNRLHSIVLTVVAVYYGIQLVSFLAAMSGILFYPEDSTIVKSPLWILTFLYFTQVVVVIILAIMMTRKLRIFERRFFSTAVDEKRPTGETFSKRKFIWTVAPDLLEEWLANMSAEGNHLVRMKGGRYIFEKGQPKYMSYVYDYQLKATPSYYDIHKSEGWDLKYTMEQSFMKPSIWAKGYAVGEKKPRFIYNRKDRKTQVLKVLFAGLGSTILLLALMLFVLWVGLGINREGSIFLIDKTIFGVLAISLLIPLFSLVRLLKYTYRMRNI